VPLALKFSLLLFLLALYFSIYFSLIFIICKNVLRHPTHFGCRRSEHLFTPSKRFPDLDFQAFSWRIFIGA
jgi:hypothetical protein